MSTLANSEDRRLACLATYPPRQCGIATFSQDLCGAISDQLSDPDGCEIIAVNDVPRGYPYNGRVRFEIPQEDPAGYRLAADFMNIRDIDLLLVQHEYGIFGGRDGKYLFSLLRKVRMPVITTMHTVLHSPPDHLRDVTEQLLGYSDRVVVMSETAVEILKELYGVDRDKVEVIPHGVPDLAFVDPNVYKDQFGVAGRKVMLTFGLVSPGKGLEYSIEALAKLVDKHPDLVFIVLGATHPNIKETQGEEYRHKLERMADKLGVLDHVIFQNRYVSLEELCEYLLAADIYVTPYLAEQQIVSGTLSYAMAAGNAIVSTPYLYAKEVLADNRGRLVPFRDSDAIAREVGWLLENETERHDIRKRAYLSTRNMVWKEVARSYLDLCDDVLSKPSICRRQNATANNGSAVLYKALPELKLDHLSAMTDGTGILQHSRFTIPDRNHGYCTDDNARALMVALNAFAITKSPSTLALAKTYLGFLAHAFNPETGRFRNFMSYDRQWLEESGSDDSHGRALWGLGVAVKTAPHDTLRASAVDLFHQALPAAEELEYSRSCAFSLIGVCAYLERYSGDTAARRIGESLAETLYDRFAANSNDDDWVWGEDLLSYANAKLPHALLVAGSCFGRNDMIETGLRSLEWLIKVQTAEESFLTPVGNLGWYPRDGEKARFDQQPIEAHALVEACVQARNITGDEAWGVQARHCFDWFMGKNDLGEPLYDFQTGGCCDGLHPEGVNPNEGAESTLAWLLSLLAVRSLAPLGGKIPQPADVPTTVGT